SLSPEKATTYGLGAIVEATILRVLNREEADLTKGMDLILMESMPVSDLSRALQLFIKHAAKLFHVEMGHIRLLSDDGTALEMAAGVGDYYDAFKLRRQKTLIMGDSPTALAFRQNGVVVVNDSRMDPWQADVLRSCQDDMFAHSALETARSFANTPITEASGSQHGTISLMSHEPWFFTRPRVRAMESLNQRAAYLIKHFKAEKERKFLLDIGSDFVRNADFAEPVQTINQAVKRFRWATNADYAGLFIWDEEANRFILRAQDGWANDKWVDADRYKMGERWTGSLGAEQMPQYVPDLFARKKKLRISSDRYYENHVFGDVLSENFTVEAIGLPLRLKQETIGVLTLYRRRDPKALSKHSGFTTTDPKILQEAADTLSAMLSALLYNLRMDWWKVEMKHHEEVREALEKGDHRIPLGQRLCQQIVQSFKAERAILYLASPNKTKQFHLTWAAAASQHTDDPLLHQEPDRMAIRAARVKSILEKKKDYLSEEEWKNPVMAKTEGLLERACLPLWHDEQLIGVLDLRFRTLRTVPHLVALHDPRSLEELADKIALVFQQQRELEKKAGAEAEAERGKLAVQAMGAMVFQTAHRLMNLTQSIRSLGILIETAGDERERDEGLSDLFKLVNSASDSIKRPMEVARRMKALELEPQDLHFLIAEALLESDIRQQLPKIDVGLLIPPKLTALADHELMREVFRNTIHNAVKAMPRGGSLRIWAGLNPNRKTVQITFTDTGYGMSEEEKQAALSGFVTTPSGTGLGVLVSLLLIRAQDGNLEIESKKGEGTKVTVTLPAIQQET
ncbi:MAG: GAF domain-containing protein, partial [Acidobacteriota bacterium]